MMNSTFPASSGDCERDDERDEDLQWKEKHKVSQGAPQWHFVCVSHS